MQTLQKAVKRAEHDIYDRVNAHVHLIKAAGKPVTTPRLAGRLIISKSGWGLLEVPNSLARGAFDALNEPGIELPKSHGKFNAHISVLHPKDIAHIGGAHKITERGHVFHYNLGPVKSVFPKTWKGVSKVWMLDVHSPELQAFRKSYGLSPLPKDGKHDFHITVGVRKVNVLQENQIKKVAAIDKWADFKPVAVSPWDALEWYDVPRNVIQLYKSLAPLRTKVAAALNPWLLPGDKVLWNQEQEQLLLVTAEPRVSRFADMMQQKLAASGMPLALVTNEMPDDGNWILLKCGSGYLASAANTVSSIPKLFGDPNPMTSAITGGLLGAGVGYGAGWVGDQLLPQSHFNRNRLRRTGALLGGLAGAAGPMWLGALSHRQDVERPGHTFGDRGAGWLKPWPFAQQSATQQDLQKIPSPADPALQKFAEFEGNTGTMFLPTIPVDAFNRAIWNDVSTAPNRFGSKSTWGDNSQPMGTPAPIAAAAASLVGGAAAAMGGSEYVSPWSVGLAAATGGGKGLIAGMLTGKVLGALAGLTPEVQQQLQSAGLWGGALTAAIRAAF